jgi:hypothetical protein
MVRGYQSKFTESFRNIEDDYASDDPEIPLSFELDTPTTTAHTKPSKPLTTAHTKPSKPLTTAHTKPSKPSKPSTTAHTKPTKTHKKTPPIQLPKPIPHRTRHKDDPTANDGVDAGDGVDGVDGEDGGDGEDKEDGKDNIEESFVGSYITWKYMLKIVLLSLVITLFIYLYSSKEMCSIVRYVSSKIKFVSYDIIFYGGIFLVIYLILLIFN